MNRTGRKLMRVGGIGGIGVFLALGCGDGDAGPSDDPIETGDAVETGEMAAPTGEAAAGEGATTPATQVAHGRQLVLTHGCGDCHGGFANPDSPEFLSGYRDPTQEFVMLGEFTTYPRNLTPHNETGLGRFSERQIFNALRYGLRPGETPDVEITSTTPGEGNFPLVPKYLAPPMPWPAFRHMSDDELTAIAAYLKRGLRPIENLVPVSEGPPDFWASLYVPEMIGAYPAPPFPAAAEQGGGG